MICIYMYVFTFTGDATEYSKHLFRVLDTDNDNMVSWKEIMLGFHYLSPNGDPDQKLKLVYSVSLLLHSNVFDKYKYRFVFTDVRHQRGQSCHSR